MMQRNLPELTNQEYDLLIIGGGIYGACIAWDATLRGLTVALVEKSDFASATSANSLKIIHGGLRYLQRGDFIRMRVSDRERRTLMQIAPHLVHPLPVVIPAFGHGLKGREALAAGLAINALVSIDKENSSDPQKYLPRGRTISRTEFNRLVPELPGQSLTGGAIFYDAQVYNSERLVISFLRSAARKGAHLANYVEVNGFLLNKDRVIGVTAKDVLTDQPLEIRAKTIVNASGPWVDHVLGMLPDRKKRKGVVFAVAWNFVTRPIFQDYAVGIPLSIHDSNSDATTVASSRFLFIAPWRDNSLVGTAYNVFHEKPGKQQVTEKQMIDFISEVNFAYPPAKLDREDIALFHCGLVPISGSYQEGKHVQLSTRSQIIDHRSDGLEGLISVLGVKYTTARNVAEKAVDLVFETRNVKPPPSLSHKTRILGGRIDRFNDYVEAELQQKPYGLPEDLIRRLILNYGSEYGSVLSILNKNDIHLMKSLEPSQVTKAEVLYGVREEMAQTLADIVFQRTELGTAGQPGIDKLRFCAEVMATELGWSQSRIDQEIDNVTGVFPNSAYNDKSASKELADSIVQ